MYQQMQQQGGQDDIQIVRQSIEEAHNQNDIELQNSPWATPIICSFQAIGKPCQLVQGENSYFKCQDCRMVMCERHWLQDQFKKYLCHNKNRFREHKKCVRGHTLYLIGTGHLQNCQGKKNVLQEFLDK